VDLAKPVLVEGPIISMITEPPVRRWYGGHLMADSVAGRCVVVLLSAVRLRSSIEQFNCVTPDDHTHTAGLLEIQLNDQQRNRRTTRFLDLDPVSQEFVTVGV